MALGSEPELAAPLVKAWVLALAISITSLVIVWLLALGEAVTSLVAIPFIALTLEVTMSHDTTVVVTFALSVVAELLILPIIEVGASEMKLSP